MRALRYGLVAACFNFAASFALLADPAAAAPLRILAFGDSLTAGLGVAPEEAFPARLEAHLKAAGLDVQVTNAGVSGDTTSGGLARLDWALGDKPQIVVLELGANDALRGIDPKLARANLDRMLEKTRLVVCSDQAEDRIREQLPQDVEVILAYRRLDSGGIEMLRDVLAQVEEPS